MVTKFISYIKRVDLIFHLSISGIVESAGRQSPECECQSFVQSSHLQRQSSQARPDWGEDQELGGSSQFESAYGTKKVTVKPPYSSNCEMNQNSGFC